MDDARLAELAWDGLAGWIGSLATGPPAARCLRFGLNVALVVPSIPHRAIFNSVVVRDTRSLAGVLDEVERVYEEAGCRWTVWVDGRDERAATLLRERGHVLDAEPPSMGAVIDKMTLAAPAEEVEVADDPLELGRLNDLAYGWPGDWSSLCDGYDDPRVAIYFARSDGALVAGAMIVADDDRHCAIEMVATHPDHGRKGWATKVLSQALLDARAKGIEVTTLQSSQQGHAVYERLGYRDVAPLAMWEKQAGTE